MAKAQGRKSIFITGAASGMGRATAKLFHAKGWFVGAVDVNDEGLKSLEQEIGSENCLIRHLDVRDKDDYDKAIAEFGEETGGKLDVLYNNAGIGAAGWFEDVPYEETRRVIDINFIGVINGIYAALPLLKATPNSLCFTTSSSSATYGMPRIATYSATKHAVKGLTEALSIEFDRLGVRCADVLPGLIDTPILTGTENYSDDDGEERPTPQENAPKRGMFRLMPPDAVAEAAWKAYHHPKKLHWYVPPGIAWIDRIKGFWPEFIRGRMLKLFAQLAPPEEKN